MPVGDLFLESESLQGNSHLSRAHIAVCIQFNDYLFTTSSPSPDFFSEICDPGGMGLLVSFNLLEMPPVLSVNSSLGLFLFGSSVLVWEVACD